MTAQPGRAVPWDEIAERRRDRDAKAPGAPRDTAACKSDNCRAKIRWAVTTDGKRMPVDFAPDPGGNLVRVMVARGDWRIRVLAPGEDPGPDVPRWTSHYATCPDAGSFRPRGRTAAGVSAPELAAAAALAPLGATPVPAPRPAPPPAPGTLLVIDGPSLAHRAWYAYEKTGMAAPDGRPIFAVHGFLALLVGIIDRTRPDALLVGFDDRAASTRRDLYPDYKAGRAEKDPDLYAQMDDIIDLLGALGVQVIVPTGLEADDVLGSAAAGCEATGWQCIIATSDKDAFGQISATTTVLRLRDGLANAVRMTPDTLLETVGVRPDQYLDYACLVGDKSDALDGVDGIGPKTAVKLLKAFDRVGDALRDPAGVVAAIGKAYAARLTTVGAAAALERNRDLMAIRRNIPIDPADYRLSTPAGTVAAVLTDRHLPGLVDRVAAALCPPPAPSSPPAERRRHLSVVPTPPPAAEGPAPTPPPLVPADPAPICPGCGRESTAVLPLAQLDDRRTPTLTGGEVLVDAEHPAGDLIAVLVGGVWAVRHIAAGEYYLPQEHRRRAHYCLVYPHQCAVPKCGQPARLYPAGPRCDGHTPSTPPPTHPGEPRATT